MKQVDDMPNHAIESMRIAQQVMKDCFGMSESMTAKAFVAGYFDTQERLKDKS